MMLYVPLGFGFDGHCLVSRVHPDHHPFYLPWGCVPIYIQVCSCPLVTRAGVIT